MTEIEFFNFLLDYTLNDKIKWKLSSAVDNNERQFIQNKINFLKFANVELHNEDYFIDSICTTYGSEEVKNIVNKIFDYVSNKEKILNKAFETVMKELNKQ